MYKFLFGNYFWFTVTSFFGLMEPLLCVMQFSFLENCYYCYWSYSNMFLLSFILKQIYYVLTPKVLLQCTKVWGEVCNYVYLLVYTYLWSAPTWLTCPRLQTWIRKWCVLVSGSTFIRAWSSLLSKDTGWQWLHYGRVWPWLASSDDCAVFESCVLLGRWRIKGAAICGFIELG